MDASRLVSDPRHAERTLTIGTMMLTGLAALIAVRGIFFVAPLDGLRFTIAIPLLSASCAGAVFYAARRFDHAYVAAALMSAVGVGCLNFIALVCLLPGPLTVSVDAIMSVTIMSIIGGVFGLCFGVALLPAVYLARLERKEPSTDWIARVSMVLAIYAGLVIVLETLVSQRTGPMTPVMPGMIPLAAGIMVTLALLALARDLCLLRLLRHARAGERGLSLQVRGRKTLPLLFRPAAFEPYDALVHTRSLNIGPFRDERTERRLAWVPRGQPRGLYVRLVCELTLLSTVSLMLLSR